MKVVVSTTSMCAVHFDAPSIITCRRCGRFCCMSCLPQLETCTECVARATLSLPPLEGRATLAAVGLWASAAMHGVMVLLAAAQIATGQPGEEGLLVIADAFVAVLYLAVFITTIVLVCRWFHLATRYGLARSVSLDVSTPASAVWSWFIPFVNLARPFNIARDLVRSAGLDGEAVSTWQALWIAGNVSANISARIEGEAGLAVGIVSDLLMVGAGLLSASIVRKLKWP